MAAWTGVEEQNFERVIEAFKRQTGGRVTQTSASLSVPAALGARTPRGATRPGLSAQARDSAPVPSAGLLVPLDQTTPRVLKTHIADYAWRADRAQCAMHADRQI
jgi:hypothetical protein